MNQTQLTTASGFNPKNIIFSQPNVANIPNSNLTYKRINIGVKNPDGTVGDLILATEKLFSFGVSENRSMETQQVNGYVMPLCLWSKDGATNAETQWTDAFNGIVEACKEYLVEHRSDIEIFDLEMNDLKKFNPLYWKKEKGKVVPGTGPTLYSKLIISKRDGVERVKSDFYDMDTQDQIDPMQLIGKYCYVRAAVKIESIFVGTKCSLQVKLWEAQVSLLEKGIRRLLAPAPPTSATRTFDTSNKDADEQEQADVQSNGSLDIDDSDDDYAAPVAKKPVRSTRKK